jgi:hypothetical protein
MFRCSYYPYVLAVDSGFLLATLVVYTALPELLNSYTRLMRHFTFNMFVAKVLLAVNQFVYLGDFSRQLCVSFGERGEAKYVIRSPRNDHLSRPQALA